MKLEECLHYLRVLFKQGVLFQPEIREALEEAIRQLEKLEEKNE